MERKRKRGEENDNAETQSRLIREVLPGQQHDGQHDPTQSVGFPCSDLPNPTLITTTMHIHGHPVFQVMM